MKETAEPKLYRFSLALECFLNWTPLSGLAFFNGEYKEGELYRNQCLPYSILVTETTSPATPARARTAQTAVQTAASWFAASRSMR